jgi:hypothetical protein
MIVAICGFAIICGAVSMKIAAGKQRNPSLWAIVGLTFNIPGLLVVALVPAHVEKPRVEAPAKEPSRARGAKAAVA